MSNSKWNVNIIITIELQINVINRLKEIPKMDHLKKDIYFQLMF
jgi:hypothetical protein